MSGQFKVGEVLVGQNITAMPQYNGVECTVVEGLKMRSHFCRLTKERINTDSYRVQWADGLVICVWPQHLRRKQPPSGEQSVLRMFTQPMQSKEIA